MEEENRLSILEKINNKIFSFSLLQTNGNNESHKNIIFVYTPPKVGSTCLVTSIRLSASHKFCVLHIHDEIMLNFMVDCGGVDVTVNEIIKYNKYLGKNVYVIDVYRTPMERKFSVFFEKISVYHFNNTEDNINNYKVERISKRFNNVFPHLSLGDHYADKFGIEVQSFKEGQIYDIQTVSGIKYIKLRLKDSNKWGHILTDLLNTKIVIIKDYETTDKNIGKLYNNFKETYNIPLNYFQMIENDEHLSLYYSPSERSEYLESWRKKLLNISFDNYYTEDEYKFYVNLCMENQFYNDVQLEHYIDCGCLCSNCSTKRKELFNKLKTGIRINEKIIHNEIVKELKEQIKKKLQNNQIIKPTHNSNSELSNVMNMSSSNKINRNTMTNVIGTKI